MLGMERYIWIVGINKGNYVYTILVVCGRRKRRVMLFWVGGRIGIVGRNYVNFVFGVKNGCLREEDCVWRTGKR